ncbi:MAG: ATP-dependent Clp protease adaptor ClpS [Bacteroidaceae bacterium]|nr:ATP-dependent Clp protease adaptor ClpS [Bacteroidaceae bacterium]
MGKTQGNIKEKTNLGLREPGKYKVIMHNDDFTTMEFVESVLQTVFRHTAENATALMMKIHDEGRAVVGIYSLDIAISKVQKATMMARNENFPLKITYEKD